MWMIELCVCVCVVVAVLWAVAVLDVFFVIFADLPARSHFPRKRSWYAQSIIIGASCLQASGFENSFSCCLFGLMWVWVCVCVGWLLWMAWKFSLCFRIASYEQIYFRFNLHLQRNKTRQFHVTHMPWGRIYLNYTEFSGFFQQFVKICLI